MISRISSVVFSLLVCGVFSFAQQSPRPLPKVTIAGSEVRSMKSAKTGRNYDIYIHLPSDYAKDPAKRYPVIYLLDGQCDFKLMDSVMGGLVYDKFAPEVFLVGITYSGENADYNSLRAMDYTPAADSSLRGSGDAAKFHAFLKSELIPMVEANYRVDSAQRYLMGSSFAGEFTLFALFTDPSMFKGYIAASPAVQYGDRFAFKQEEEFSKAHKELPVRLFIGVGGIEDLSGPVQEFAKVLKSRNYKGLTLETRVIQGERHAGNKPELYNRAVRWMFAQNQ